MSCITCDLGAWTIYASRAPLSPVPKDEADLALQEAACTKAEADRVRRSWWFSSLAGFSRMLAGVPPRHPVPAHLAAPTCRRHGRSQSIVAHRLPVSLPTDPILQFDEVDGPLYVASPALYLLMRAPLLDDIGLILAATALCSTYVRRPDMNGEIVYRSKPLVASQELVEKLRPCKSQRSCRRLTELLSFCQDESASPMETALALLMTAPPSLGGRGFPRAKMNYEWKLAPDECFTLNGQETIRLDFFWPEAALGIEYDSAEFHDNPRQMERDAARREIAERRGIHVMTVTRGAVKDELKLNLLLEQAAERLGMGFDWSDRYLSKRRLLRSRVLGEHLFW